MNLLTPSSTISTDSVDLHCNHRTITGRRCRMIASESGSGLCLRHAATRQKADDLADLSSALTERLTEFKTAVNINGFLSRLLRLQAEARISPRRASVMAYTCNLLLRTVPAVDKELHPEDYDGIVRVDFGDLPRPPY